MPATLPEKQGHRVVRDEFLAAIEDEQLLLLYQPQMTSDGSTIAAVEALARWQHPRLGMLGPSTFIPVAEEHGLEREFGLWVLRRACEEASRWPGLSVAVNVSAPQIRSPDFVDEVEAVAARAGLPFDRLELEIVESSVIDDFAAAERVIARLRSLGVRVALDDFGTGYSSLAYLRRLPLDKIKIDRSFVQEVDQMQSAAIVHAVVALGRALGLKITAEGVETPEQHRFMRAAGCHYMQGYLFSPPVPAVEIAQRLAEAAGGAPVMPRRALAEPAGHSGPGRRAAAS